MFGHISFYIGDKTLEINGKKFKLGEFSTEFLNLPKEDYAKMREKLDIAEEKLNKYIETKDIGYWFYANEEYILLDEMMKKYSFISLIREKTDIFEDTRAFTSQIDAFGDYDCKLTEEDLYIILKRGLYQNYIDNPDDYGGYKEEIYESEITGKTVVQHIKKPDIPSVPPEKTRAMMIISGDKEAKFNFYKEYCDAYKNALLDIESFNNTIYNFIKFYLKDLKTLDSNNYAWALYTLFNDPKYYKIIATPIYGNGNYTETDKATIRYVPRETEEGSGIFKIYQYYEVEKLQALLKADFYNALEAGFIIRKCEYCGRYFLLTKAYHTKYCDRPAPGRPQFTCAQLGYHSKGVKEFNGDNPKAQSLRRCYLRIDKDLSRGIITEEDKIKIYKKAKDLYHTAVIRSGISNEEFEKQLASKNLYPLCGVTRKTRPRGRPANKVQ